MPVRATDTTTLISNVEWWLLVNGESGSMRVSNDWLHIGAADRRAVGGAALRFGCPEHGVDFPPGACVALPHGVTVVRWPILDHHLEFCLDVGGDTSDCVATLRPEEEPVDLDAYEGTALPAGEDPSVLNPRQRRIAAVVFRYLLEGQPRPKDLAATAAPVLGCSTAMVRQDLYRIRMAVNGRRGDRAELTNADQLGEYLVLRARIIPSDDDLLR